MIAISPGLRQLLKAVSFINWALWASITGSMGIYIVLAFFLSEGKPPTELSEGLTAILVIAAVAVAGVSLLLPRFLLSDERLRRGLQKLPDAQTLARNQQKGKVDQEQLRRIQALSDHERWLLYVHQLFFTAFIVRLLLNESIALGGLLLSLLSNTVTPACIGAAAGIALNLATTPRIERLLERASRLAHLGQHAM